MPKVVLTNPIHPDAVKLMVQEGCQVVVCSPTEVDTFKQEMSDADAIIVRTPVGPEILDWAPDLKVVARHGVGLDFVPLQAATEAGLPVVFTPDANTESVAQHTISVLLAMTRNLIPQNQAVRAGDWDYRQRTLGKELQALKLGVVGLGRIGRRVAEIAHLGFKMPVYGYDPYLPVEAELSVPVTRRENLDQLLSEVDAVTLHVPLTPDTRELLDAHRFAALKPGAYLINAARGPLVNEAALLQALQDGTVKAAALDVFDEEPLPADHPYSKEANILLSPHSAALTEEGMIRMSMTVTADVLRILRGEAPENLANPQIRTEGRRGA